MLASMIFGILVPFLVRAETSTKDQQSNNEAKQKAAGKIIESVATAWNKNYTEALPGSFFQTPSWSLRMVLSFGPGQRLGSVLHQKKQRAMDDFQS
jgi:hypothetical protein